MLNLDELRVFLELGPHATEAEIAASLDSQEVRDRQSYATAVSAWFPELASPSAESRVAASLGSTSDGLADFAALGGGMGMVGRV
jgi:hypothetical protein